MAEDKWGTESCSVYAKLFGRKCVFRFFQFIFIGLLEQVYVISLFFIIVLYLSLYVYLSIYIRPYLNSFDNQYPLVVRVVLGAEPLVRREDPLPGGQDVDVSVTNPRYLDREEACHFPRYTFEIIPLAGDKSISS